MSPICLRSYKTSVSSFHSCLVLLSILMSIYGKIKLNFLCCRFFKPWKNTIYERRCIFSSVTSTCLVCSASIQYIRMRSKQRSDHARRWTLDSKDPCNMSGGSYGFNPCRDQISVKDPRCMYYHKYGSEVSLM